MQTKISEQFGQDLGQHIEKTAYSILWHPTCWFDLAYRKDRLLYQVVPTLLVRSTLG
jgi:hypothetical protein